jgi:hypothetical protein
MYTILLKYPLAVAIALHQVCCYQQTGGELLNWDMKGDQYSTEELQLQQLLEILILSIQPGLVNWTILIPFHIPIQQCRDDPKA